MNEHIKRQAEEFMNAAKAAKIPENIQAFAQEGVAKSQEAFETLTAAAKDQAKVAEDFALATQAGIKSISAKMFDNTAVNAEAAFDAARSMASATSVPEVLRLQAEFENIGLLYVPGRMSLASHRGLAGAARSRRRIRLPPATGDTEQTQDH